MQLPPPGGRIIVSDWHTWQRHHQANKDALYIIAYKPTSVCLDKKKNTIPAVASQVPSAKIHSRFFFVICEQYFAYLITFTNTSPYLSRC